MRDLWREIVRSSEARPSTSCLSDLLSRLSSSVSTRNSWARSNLRMTMLATANCILMLPTLFWPQIASALAVFLRRVSSLLNGSVIILSQVQASYITSMNPSIPPKTSRSEISSAAPCGHTMPSEGGNGQKLPWTEPGVGNLGGRAPSRWKQKHGRS